MSKTNFQRATNLFWRWYNRMPHIIPDSRKATLIANIEDAIDKAERRGARKACPCREPESVNNYTISIDGQTVGVVDVVDGRLK